MSLALHLLAVVALGLAAALLRLPPLVGFIAAGFLLGATGVEPLPWLSTVGDLGAALLLFSIGLDLDPRSSIFQDAPERPIVLTTELSRPEAREALSEVADVVICGRERVQAERGLAVLHERGLTRIHCEGGPHLFADLIAARAVDELMLSALNEKKKMKASGASITTHFSGEEKIGT